MRLDPAELGEHDEHRWRFALRVAATFDRLLTQVRRAAGVSASELQAVLALWNGGRMNMTELGREIGLSRAAITTLVDPLEAMQLIERVPDPQDRRRVLVAVTRQADAALREACASLDARLRGMDASQWRTFICGAAAAREAAQATADESTRKEFEQRKPAKPPLKY